MGDFKVERFDGPPDCRNGGRRKRNHVRIGPHENKARRTWEPIDVIESGLA